MSRFAEEDDPFNEDDVDEVYDDEGRKLELTAGLWPMPILFNIDDDIGSDVAAAVYDAIEYIQEETCITFEEIPFSNESSPFHLNFRTGSSCSSPVGQINTDRYYRQRITLGPNCNYMAVALHEIAHSLGFRHEQRRSDRDSHIEILWDNINPKYVGNFNQRETDNFDIPYDFASIMHYRSLAFTINGKPTMKAKGDPTLNIFMGYRGPFYTFYDKKIINKAYKCDQKWATECADNSVTCLNEGYMNGKCECDCKPGTTGSSCETVVSTYYEAIENSEHFPSDRKRSVITQPKTISSSKVAREVVHIKAPECNVVKIEFTKFELRVRTTSSRGELHCLKEFLQIRTDMSDFEPELNCGSDISVGETRTSLSNEMVLYSEMLSSPPTDWTVKVSFQDVCNALTVSHQVNSGGCKFVEKDGSWYLQNPNYPSATTPPFSCSVSYQASKDVTFDLAVDQFSGKKGRTYLNGQKFRNVIAGSIRSMGGTGDLFIDARSSWRNRNVMFNVRLTPQ